MTNREEIIKKINELADYIIAREKQVKQEYYLLGVENGIKECQPELEWSLNLADYILAREEQAKQEVLDYIAFGEGWEETRDFYAEKLGLTVKYKK